MLQPGSDPEAARSDVLRISKVTKAFSGTVAVDDVSFRIVSIPDAVGFVSEDRQRDTLIPEESLTNNAALSGAGNRRGTVRWAQHRERARRSIENDVRAGTSATVARTLIERQPTEVRSRSRAPCIAPDARRREPDARPGHSRGGGGAEVLAYSQDLDEVKALATRVIVVQRGQVRSVPIDRAFIGRAMLAIA